MAEPTEYKLEHIALIEKEGIDVKKIPLKIRQKMRGTPSLMESFNADPSEVNKQAIIKHDIEVADNLIDWMEQNYPDDYVEASKEETPPVKPVEETPPVKPPTTPPIDLEKVAKEAEESNRLVAEAKIIEKIKANIYDGDRITIDALTIILGKKPNYPEHNIGDFTLRNVYLGGCYKLK